ncbi:MAG TPA: ATP-binding cassette domain-containing protein [Gaiellaceae bacterium]
MTTASAFAGAARDARRSWNRRTTIAVAAFVLAAFAPLVVGSARVADLADGLYLAVAAIGLAFAVGVGGLPSLAQGAFVGVGAVVGARLPFAIAPFAGAAAGALTAWLTGSLFARLPRAGIAAATWILAWLVSFALQSITWFLGGSEGVVVSTGPAPAAHFEIALALTALAGAAYAALARAPLGLRLAAARDREAAAHALRVPVLRARLAAFGASGAAAGLAGALSVQLAGVGDPAQYGPYLSFKLFVVVLVGGAVAPLGGAVGVVVLGVLSVVADALGSLENVASARSHTLLAAILLLGVVSLGWDGLLRPARRLWRTGVAQGEPFTPSPLHADRLGKRYGEVVAAEDVSLTLEPGTITALVGPNGSGKTTILRMLAGAVSPDVGRVEHAGVARTLQATSTFASLTPLEHLLVASSARRRHGGLVRSLFATPKARAEEERFTAEARTTLERFGLEPDVLATELPAGEQRVLMLLAAAATGSPVLLVDEPTAGASVAEAARIADALVALREEGRALLVVEHNLAVVRRTADRTVALEAGRIVA